MIVCTQESGFSLDSSLHSFIHIRLIYIIKQHVCIVNTFIQSLPYSPHMLVARIMIIPIHLTGKLAALTLIIAQIIYVRKHTRIKVSVNFLSHQCVIDTGQSHRTFLFVCIERFRRYKVIRFRFKEILTRNTGGAQADSQKYISSVFIYSFHKSVFLECNI